MYVSLFPGEFKSSLNVENLYYLLEANEMCYGEFVAKNEISTVKWH